MKHATDDGTGIKLPPLYGPEPIQLVSKQLIEAYAPLMYEHFRVMVERHNIDEFIAEDLFDMALNGRCVLIAVATDRTGLNPDREVKLSLAIEVVQYPRKSGINILAIGGDDLAMLKNKFWEQFQGWAYMNGARFIEASVSPAMERMTRPWGMLPVRKTVRMDLTEK